MLKKRVLYLTNVPAPYRVEFFNDLSENCDLTVSFEMKAASNRDSEWKSSEQYKFNAIYMKPLIRKEEGAFCPEVAKQLKKFRNDIIIVGGYSTPTGMYAIWYLKTHKIPFILNCDGGFVRNDNSLKYSIKKYFISSAKAWLCAGEKSKEYLVHYGANKENIYSYPFSSVREEDICKPLSKEDKLEIRRPLGIKETKMVLYVGSFIHRKGIDCLIKAMNEIEDTALVLVGGTDLGQFNDLISDKLKGHLYIPGFFDKKGLKRYYQAADVFVLPTREDIWGLVVNEAMSYSLPVISTDKCNAALELIEQGENGFIIPADDYMELKDRIKEFFDSSEDKLSDMQMKAYEKACEYTIEKMAAEHAKIFSEWDSK